MNDNSIKITAGGDVTISGAVGNQAKSANVISIGEADIKTIEDSFASIRHEFSEACDNAIITQSQSELLNGELDQIQALTTDKKLTEEKFQSKARQLCEKMNFVCESAGSIANIAKYLILIGTTLGFNVSSLI